MNNTYKSASPEQQKAEMELLNSFAIKHKLIREKLIFPNDFSCQIDGTYRNAQDQWIWVEVYAHQGKLKGAQPKKVCTDILKLITLEKILNQSVQKYILFGNDEAMKCFQNNSWYRRAVDTWNIKLEVGALSEQTKQNLRVAQTRQKMVNVAD